MRLRSLTAFGALAGLLLAGWAVAQPDQPGRFPGRGGQPNRGGANQGGRSAPVLRGAWEYRALSQAEVEALAAGKEANRLTAGLNKLGAEGWDLIAVIPASNPLPSSTLVFKRPVPRRGRGWAAAGAEPPSAPAGPPPDRAAEIKVFRLRNAEAADMERILSKLLSTGGRAGGALRLASDQRTNSVLASGPREQLAEVEAILNRLDAPEGAKASGKK